MWYPLPAHSLDAEPDASACGCLVTIDRTGYVSLSLCSWAEHYTRIGTWHMQITNTVVTSHVRRALRMIHAKYKGDASDTVNGRKIREFALKESERRHDD